MLVSQIILQGGSWVVDYNCNRNLPLSAFEYTNKIILIPSNKHKCLDNKLCLKPYLKILLAFSLPTKCCTAIVKNYSIIRLQAVSIWIYTDGLHNLTVANNKYYQHEQRKHHEFKSSMTRTFSSIPHKSRISLNLQLRVNKQIWQSSTLNSILFYLPRIVLENSQIRE